MEIRNFFSKGSVTNGHGTVVLASHGHDFLMKMSTSKKTNAHI